MNPQDVKHFYQHYILLSDEDLEALDARKTTLLEEAQVALAKVIAERDISVERIRHRNSTDDEQLADAAREVIRRKEIRYTKYAKWFFIISAPLVVLSAILRPDKSWQTFVSSTVQALCIFVFLWIALLVKRKIKSSSKRSNEGEI